LRNVVAMSPSEANAEQKKSQVMKIAAYASIIALILVALLMLVWWPGTLCGRIFNGPNSFRLICPFLL
jgi:hypothetical protein